MSDWKHIATGFFLGLILVATLIVGVGVITRSQTVDPIPGYCRGVADGMRHAMEINRRAFEYAGVRLPEDADFFQAEQEADCIRLIDEAMAKAPYLRGPLGAGE